LKKRGVPFNVPHGLNKLRELYKREEQRMVGDIWSNCGGPNDQLEIGSVTIVPDPPQIGAPLHVEANGTLLEVVTGGNVSIVLYWGAIKIFDKSLPLCSILIPPFQCPVKEGPVSIKVDETIPKNAPSGSYSGTVKAVDSVGQELLCIALKFQLHNSEMLLTSLLM